MSSKQQLITIIVLVLCAIVVYGLISFLTEDDESRIRRVVNTAVLAAQRHDLEKCGSLVSESYHDQYGNSKSSLLEFASNLFEEFHQIKIVIKRLQIKVDASKNEGDAEIYFAAYYRVAGDKNLYGDKAKLIVHFRKETGSWKVFELEYIGSNELLFLQSIAMQNDSADNFFCDFQRHA